MFKICISISRKTQHDIVRGIWSLVRFLGLLLIFGVIEKLT